ncbi:MAG: hypothetical protein ACRD3H_17510 [Terriglobales bacterium]|jgi:hypothetical protein|nr:hypothetical protein [Terriglobales bacterium]
MNALASALIRLVEVMFVAGVLGSAIVVFLTSIEDFKMLFERQPSPANGVQKARD